jgi:hypothetical protein
MAYGIFRKFRKSRVQSNRSQDKDNLHLAGYALYAVGVPLVFSGVTAAIEFHVDVNGTALPIRPEFASRQVKF